MLDSPSRTQVIDLFPVTTSSIAADSHPGFQRSGNEDSFGYFFRIWIKVIPQEDNPIYLIYIFQNRLFPKGFPMNIWND